MAELLKEAGVRNRKAVRQRGMAYEQEVVQKRGQRWWRRTRGFSQAGRKLTDTFYSPCFKAAMANLGHAGHRWHAELSLWAHEP